MKAFRLLEPHTTRLTTVQQPEPGPGEVLVRVGAAGVCHSDLHLIEAPAGAFSLPLTLGHENAGWVEALGPEVDGWERGEPVAVYGIVDAHTAYEKLHQGNLRGRAVIIPHPANSAAPETAREHARAR